MPHSSLWLTSAPGGNSYSLEGFQYASAVNDRDGYETCVGPHGSGTVNLNITNFLSFVRRHGLRVVVP